MLSRIATTPSGSTYRYGFNGKEEDPEAKREQNQLDYGNRIYDPRVGRFLSVDPITRQYPNLTPYQFASNTPIWAIDRDGLEMLPATKMWAIRKWNEFTDWLVNGKVSMWKDNKPPDLDPKFVAALNHANHEITTLTFIVQGHFELQNSLMSEENIASKTIITDETEAATNLAIKDAGATTIVTKEASAVQNEIKVSAQTASSGLSKTVQRKAYAKEVFQAAGKNEQQVTDLMKTIDYNKAVKPTILKVGDKVYRFERINAKGESEMHFFTDAHGADAGATGVGFYNESGYQLSTYEVTTETKVMESTISGAKNKQYFSTKLEKNIKKISTE